MFNANAANRRTGFESIRKNLIIHSKLAGLSIFPGTKWSRWESSYKYAAHFIYITGMINMMVLIWMCRDQPFDMLIVSAFAFDVGSFMIPSLTIYHHKNDYLSLLDWCEQKINFVGNHTLRRIIRHRAKEALKDSQKIVRLVQIFSAFSFLVSMVLVTLIGAFLPDHIYPQFKLPLSYWIVFLKPIDWISYIINYVHQIWCTVHYVVFGMNYFGIFFIICRYLVAHLDAMIDFIKAIKVQLMNLKVDANKRKGDRTEFVFEQWIASVIEQHVEFNE